MRCLYGFLTRRTKATFFIAGKKTRYPDSQAAIAAGMRDGVPALVNWLKILPFLENMHSGGTRTDGC